MKNIIRQAPISKPKKHGFLTHRDAIWDAIRQLKTNFTSRDIAHIYVLNEHTIKDYLKGLKIAGFIKVIDKDTFKEKKGQYVSSSAFQSLRYDLIKDIGLKSPRINKKGEVVQQGKARANMWRTMRIIKEFGINDLIIHASTEETPIKLYDAKDYVKHLKKAGYLKMKVRGRQGITTRYRLMKNTGPLSPMVQKVKHLFDPNLREVVWTQETDLEKQL